MVLTALIAPNELGVDEQDGKVVPRTFIQPSKLISVWSTGLHHRQTGRLEVFEEADSVAE